MISIKDYDANYHIDPKTVRKLKNMSGILTNKLSSVPIFFVKRETIDRHCRGICLSTECTDDLFNSGEFDRYHQDFFEKEIRNIRIRDFGYVFPNEENVNRLFEKLKGCVMMCDAIGCYISNSDEIYEKPHILTCPEKINYSGKRQFEAILLEVILHELTHAFFSSEDNQELTNHIVEESLCDAYAISRFRSKEYLFEFMSDHLRPPEYRSYVFWIEISKSIPLVYFMHRWKTKNYFEFSYFLVTKIHYDIMDMEIKGGYSILRNSKLVEHYKYFRDKMMSTQNYSVVLQIVALMLLSFS